MSDLMQQFMDMAGPPAGLGGAPAGPPPVPGQVPTDGPPVPPEMTAGEVEDPQLVTGVIELEPGLKVARSIAQKVIDIENKFGVQCIEGYREKFSNKRRQGTAEHSYHEMTEDGHGAADFSGKPRQLQNASAYAKTIGAIESSVHNDGRGQILHVAF